jgi:hypothetical protein
MTKGSFRLVFRPTTKILLFNEGRLRRSERSQSPQWVLQLCPTKRPNSITGRASRADLNEFVEQRDPITKRRFRVVCSRLFDVLQCDPIDGISCYPYILLFEFNRSIDTEWIHRNSACVNNDSQTIITSILNISD